MVPIGVVTRDRVAYLDVTLRSLSATALPPDVPVIIFDDHSTEKQTRLYYATKKRITHNYKWPTGTAWKKILGPAVVNSTYADGIQSKISVISLGNKPAGVVNASCHAIRVLFEKYPDAPGVILLQDDIVFKVDWYDKMLQTIANSKAFTEKHVGLLAGIKLNHNLRFTEEIPIAVSSGVTAQCLYVSRKAYKILQSKYFGKHHKSSNRFDDTLRRAVSGANMWAGCIYPFVCQHIGIKSIVRPQRSWRRGKNGRIGYYVQPPYSLADEVKKFEGR